jgi:hypothetical protein
MNNLYIFAARGSYFGGAIGVVAGSSESVKSVIKRQQEQDRVEGRWYASYENEPFIFDEDIVKEINKLEDEGYEYGISGVCGSSHVWVLSHIVPNVDLPEGILFQECHTG